jgi:regulator of protease activity HflC (stomatin/prohibitin superfamily)
MASMSRVLFWRHLRADANSHVIHYSGGNEKRAGRGLAFWFFPLSASVAEVPCDDRDQAFLFRGRSSDFQEVTAQGVVTYRVAAPEKLASRLDFSLDLDTGDWQQSPLDQLAQLITQMAQQLAGDYVARTPVKQLLIDGVEQIRERLADGLPNDQVLWSLGLEVVSVRVSQVAPTSELEKALQAPTRESIQQEADEAAFSRRALAVEKERAIQENELQNQIELARREEQLIQQRGQNEQRRIREDAEAKQLEVEARTTRQRLEAGAKAEGIRVVEGARVEGEKARMEIYRDLPTQVLVGLAAQELAGKLQRIDHLNVTPELFGPLLGNLIQAGTKKLEGDANA